MTSELNLEEPQLEHWILDAGGEAQQVTGSHPHWTLLSPAAQATQP